MGNVIDKARQLRPYIERGVASLGLTAEEALSCMELYARWDSAKTYKTGERIRYGGLLYECIQGDTAQADWTPDTAVSLWDEVRVDPATGYDEWQQPSGAHDAYNIGDRVIYNGKIYESLINGNTYSPDVYPAGWKEVAG